MAARSSGGGRGAPEREAELSASRRATERRADRARVRRRWQLPLRLFVDLCGCFCHPKRSVVLVNRLNTCMPSARALYVPCSTRKNGETTATAPPRPVAARRCGGRRRQHRAAGTGSSTDVEETRRQFGVWLDWAVWSISGRPAAGNPMEAMSIGSPPSMLQWSAICPHRKSAIGWHPTGGFPKRDDNCNH